MVRATPQWIRFRRRSAVFGLSLALVVASANVAPCADVQTGPVLSVPAVALKQPLRIPLPVGQLTRRNECLTLCVDTGNGRIGLPISVVSGPNPTGDRIDRAFLVIVGQVMGKSPSGLSATPTVVGELQPAGSVDNLLRLPQGCFRFQETSEATVTLYENDAPVLAYNFGPITNPNVPEKDPRRTRACYIHPVWGLDGEILTDDFPKDHYHHHGIFWTWPHVVINGEEFSLWEDRGELRQRFVKWLCRETQPNAAVLGVENAWMLKEQPMVTERIWVTVYTRGEEERAIDIDLFLQPHVPVTLWGAEGKSYGGLTMRFRPPSEKEARITVPDGLTTEDLYETRLPWADFTSRFADGDVLSGGTVMIAPPHPDYPPMWLTRHYGPLCVGWPGTQSRTLQPGEVIHLPYRIWIHKGAREASQIAEVYRAYMAGFEATFTQKADR